MSTKNKYAVILGNLGNTCDRFLSSGYKDSLPKPEMIKLAASIAGIQGIELVGGWDVVSENAAEIGVCMKDHGLECVSIIPDLFSQRQWGMGAFCSREPRIRRAALDETRRAVEIARQIGCPLLNLWLGQDGYDYPLQGNFGAQRGWMVEGIRCAAQEAPDLRFALEYKPKEPRIHSFQARAADTLLMAQENVAESAWLLQHHGNKLFHLHYNDNYGHWDDDMIVGSVHLTHYIELYYWLKKTGYSGWHSMDLYPYREDGGRAVAESVAFLRDLERSLTETKLNAIGGLLESGDATASTRWVREFIFGGTEK